MVDERDYANIKSLSYCGIMTYSLPRHNIVIFHGNCQIDHTLTITHTQLIILTVKNKVLTSVDIRNYSYILILRMQCKIHLCNTNKLDVDECNK